MNESVVEDAAISWFAQIAYTVGHGPHIAPGEPGAERSSFANVILEGRLQDAIHRLNPLIPQDAQEDALRNLLRLEASTFVGSNRAFHKMLLIVSDGLQARIGSLTANQEWFKVWRTVDGAGDAPRASLEREVLVRGVFDKRRFLDLLQHFIVFEEDTDSDRLHKIIAVYREC